MNTISYRNFDIRWHLFLRECFSDSGPQEERHRVTAGWWRAPGRRTTVRCWSVPAARAWSPGSTTLSREAGCSWREVKTERKRSRERRGPNMFRTLLPATTSLQTGQQEVQIKRQKVDVSSLENGLTGYMLILI